MTGEVAYLALELDSRPVVQGAEALDRLTPAAQRAEAAADGLSATFTKTAGGARALGAAANENTTATANLQQRLASLRAQVDPLAASQQRLARATGEANALLRAGAVTQQEHARLIGLASRAHADLETRVGRSSRAVGLSANDWRMLSFQANDAVTMLASGSSAFQVLATQGGQVFQVFQGAQGGVTGALAGVATAGGAAVTGVTALVGALVAGAAAYATFDTAQKQTQRSLLGAGRASGLTAADVRDIAARSPLSDSFSEGLAGQLASTGNADRGGIARALSMTRDLAATMNTSTADAGKTIVDLASGGVASLDKLNAQYRFLSASQRQRISDLQNEGRGAEAFKLSLDALSGGLGRYNELASVSTKLGDRLSGGIDQIKSGISRGVASLFGDDRVQPGVSGLTAQRASLTNEATALTKQLADIEAARKRAFGSPVDEATLDGLYPADRIRLRLEEIAKAQEDVSRRLATATQAQVQAQRIANFELQRMQNERILTVTTGLERQNDLARRNPVDQQVVQAQREAGIYTEKDMGSALRRYGDPQAYQPYVSQRDRYGDKASDPAVGPAMPPAVRPTMSADRFNDTFSADKESYAATIQKQVAEGSRIQQNKQLTESQRSSTLALDGETQALGRSAGAAEAARQRAAQRISLGQQGIEIDKETTKRIDEQADAYGRLVQKFAEGQLRRDITFERDQIGRDRGDAAVAARLRPVYGDDQSSTAARRDADRLREVANLGEAKGMVNDSLTSIITNFRRTGDAAKAASDAAGNLADRGIAKLIDMLTSSAFDSIGKGGGGGILKLLGFADGGYTGYGSRHEPAGIVHRGEVVWSQADVTRYGGAHVVERMRLGYPGYAAGGPVGWRQPSGQVPANSNGGAPVINFIPPPGVPLEADGPARRNSSGGYDQALRMVGNGLAKQGIAGRGALREQFNTPATRLG